MPDQKTLQGTSNMQQINTSAIVTRLENWHETYTRLNPWAHGGLIERAIQKLSRSGGDGQHNSASHKRDAGDHPARLTLITKEKASTVLRA